MQAWSAGTSVLTIGIPPFSEAHVYGPIVCKQDMKCSPATSADLDIAVSMSNTERGHDSHARNGNGFLEGRPATSMQTS